MKKAQDENHLVTSHHLFEMNIDARKSLEISE